MNWLIKLYLKCYSFCVCWCFALWWSLIWGHMVSFFMMNLNLSLLLLFNLQVLQGGGLESPTKPKGRPKKNSIPSSEQLSEQERSAADADRQSEGSSSHLENTQEEWPGLSLHALGLYVHNPCDVQHASFLARTRLWDGTEEFADAPCAK